MSRQGPGSVAARWSLLLALSLIGPGAEAQPLGARALSHTTTSAFVHWKAAVEARGWTGMQREIATCYAALAARPTQAKAAYCTALDHYTLLDAMNYPANLRPAYFATDAVFARLDHAVALSTPPTDRARFASALLVAMDETLHAAHEASLKK